MKQFTRCWHFFLAVFLILPLAACFEEETVSLSYLGLNHTDQGIVSVKVNGEGGILSVSPQGGGGAIICCIVLPKKWRPGLMATIKWQNGGAFQRDERGRVMTQNGVPIVIESPWKERTVEVPRYDASLGDFYILFYPNDVVRVAVSNGIPDLKNPSPAQSMKETSQ